MSLFKNATKHRSTPKSLENVGQNDAPKLKESIQKSKSLDRIKRNDVSSVTSAGKNKHEKPSSKPEASPKMPKSTKKATKRSLSDTGKLKIIHQSETSHVGLDVDQISPESTRAKSECSNPTSDKPQSLLPSPAAIVAVATTTTTTTTLVSHHRKLSGPSAKELQTMKPKKQLPPTPKSQPASAVNSIHVPGKAKLEASARPRAKSSPMTKQASVESSSSAVSLPVREAVGEGLLGIPPRPKSSQSGNTASSRSPKSPHSTLGRAASGSGSKSRIPVSNLSASGSKQTIAAKMDKATKARLYLVRKMGHTTFVVTGDNLENQFRVTVGSQTCTCGKVCCIHLLFVMLRVLKVPQDSSYLSAKDLKISEVNSLLSQYESRVSRQTSIGKQRKRLSKGDSFLGSSSSSFQSSMSSDLTDVLLSVNQELKGKDLSKLPAIEDDLSSVGGSDREDTATTDQDMLDFEEELCPICLLELVEGEDVVICFNCQNELHQHCMDIWAQELSRRDEDTWCPLCRSSWRRDGLQGRGQQPASIPQSKDPANPNFRQRTKSDAVKITLRDAKLDRDTLVAILVEHLPKSSSEHLFAPSWKTRESTLLRLRRCLVSSIVTKSGEVRPIAGHPCDSVVSACCGVAAVSCCDPVLKVFLASLELLRALFNYCICSSEKDQLWLRGKLKPALSILLTRCYDAQSRVKECALQVLLDVCLGQDGPLASGSGSGQQSPFSAGGMPYIFTVLCEDPPQTLRKVSQWWMGRLMVLDHLMSKFEQHMTSSDSEEPVTPPQPSRSLPTERTTQIMSKMFGRSESSSSCESTSSYDSRKPVSSPNTSNDFLLLTISFAAKSTHVQNYKSFRLAKRIIMRAVKFIVLSQDTFISALEGISHASSSVKTLWLRKACKMMMEAKSSLTLSRGILEAFGNFIDLERMQASRCEQASLLEDVLDPSTQSNVSNSDMEPFDVESASDTDYKMLSKQSSSVFSERSFLEGSPFSKDSSITSNEQRLVQEVVEEARVSEQPTSTSTPLKIPPTQREEEAPPPKSDEQVIGEMLICRKSVEQEEEEDFAKLMSQLPSEDPLPPLTGIDPPGMEALVYIQTGPLADQQDGGEATSVTEYIEGMHWTKGKVIGTGAYCTCFLARDVKTGTIMAAKQVSYCRNTPIEEEKELKRLKEEVAMLGRLKHPNIVRCLGATQVQGHFNIFVEWMAGGSVDQLISEFGVFNEAVIIKYAKQIMLGVGYLHEWRAIHRDIKGANILVDSTGQRVRVADFGAAARLAAQVTGAGEFRNDMQGTVAFMAPEVVRGDHYGRRCDVWSIGCVVIQMATGNPPWGAKEATNSYALIYKIAITKEPPHVPEFSNPALKDVTLRCLEVNPSERPHITDLLRHSLWHSNK